MSGLTADYHLKMAEQEVTKAAKALGGRHADHRNSALTYLDRALQSLNDLDSYDLTLAEKKRRERVAREVKKVNRSIETSREREHARGRA